jgi:nucleoside-diphosphate-sugar epimerase
LTGNVINIGSGERSTLEGVAKLIKKITKSKSQILFDETYLRNKESRCYADISKAKTLLNWEPQHTLLMGLRKMV